MIRRIFVTGLGAIGGVVGGFASLHILLPRSVFLGSRIGWRIVVLFAVGGSTLALGLFERLRMVPSDEQLEKQQKPISLFSNGDEHGKTAPPKP